MTQMESFENSESRFREAMKAKKQGRNGEAIRLLRLALTENPSHAEAHQELGWLLFGISESLEEPRRLLEEAVRLDPGSGDAHLFLGVVLGKLHEPDLADFHFNRAIVLTDFPALCRATYGKYLGQTGRLPEAERELSTAVRLDPNCLPAVRDYAHLLSVQGEDAGADEYFLRALALDPEDKLTNHYYGWFLSSVEGREKEAEKFLRRAIELDPHYEDAKSDLKALMERLGRS